MNEDEIEEPKERGSIIRFSLVHDANPKKSYRYAAIKTVRGKWFTTGSSCPQQGYTWAELLKVLRNEHHPSQPYFDVIWPVPTMRRVYL